METEALCVSSDHATTMEIERAQITGETAAIWLRCPACQRAIAIFLPVEIYRDLVPTLRSEKPKEIATLG